MATTLDLLVAKLSTTTTADQGNPPWSTNIHGRAGNLRGPGDDPSSKKLTDKIWRSEFVDTGEMLVDNCLQRSDVQTTNPTSWP